jgi:hypothetical protein
VNPVTLLRDLIGRVVSAQEALEVGDTDLAYAILVDLEGDVVGSLAALSMEEAA